MQTKKLIDFRNEIFRELVRYMMVGAVAFAVDFGLLVILTEIMKIFYLLSATISFVLGLLVSYGLSIAWVFENRTMTNKWAEFLVFSLVGVVGLILNTLIIWFFTDEVSLHYTLSKIIATAIVFFWNYIARKFTLFK